MTYSSNTAEHSHQGEWSLAHGPWTCHECGQRIEPGDKCLEIGWTISRAFFAMVCRECALHALNPDCTVRYAFPCVLEELRRERIKARQARGQ